MLSDSCKNRSLGSINQSHELFRPRHHVINSHCFFSKHESRNSYYDKEDQYDQILKMKQEVNLLKMENVQLKAQNTYFQKDLENFQHQLSDDDNQVKTVRNQYKFKQLLKTISQKDQEIEFLKRKLKYDEIMELQEQVQKLQGVIEIQNEKLLGNSRNILTPQFQVLEELESDNIKLVGIVKSLEEKLKITEQLKKQNIRQQVRIQQQQQLIVQLQSEIRQFKERDLLFAVKHNQKSKQDQQIKKLLSDIHKLSQKRQEDEAYIEQMIDQHRQEIKKYDRRIMEKDEELQLIQERCESLSKALQEEQIQKARLKKTEKSNSTVKASMFSQHQIENRRPGDFSLITSQRSLSGMGKSKYSKMNKLDLNKIAKVIKFQMINNKLQFEEMETHLFNNQEEITLDQLQDALQKQIFNLSKEQATTLANYLFDSEEDFTSDKSQSITRIKSILKNLLDNFKLPTQQILSECLQNLSSNMELIKNQIRLKQSTPRNKLNLNDLFQTFLENDIRFSKSALEFMESQFYKMNHGHLEQYEIQQLDNLIIIINQWIN